MGETMGEVAFIGELKGVGGVSSVRLGVRFDSKRARSSTLLTRELRSSVRFVEFDLDREFRPRWGFEERGVNVGALAGGGIDVP